MECTAVRDLLSRKIDHELSEFENASSGYPSGQMPVLLTGVPSSESAQSGRASDPAAGTVPVFL